MNTFLPSKGLWIYFIKLIGIPKALDKLDNFRIALAEIAFSIGFFCNLTVIEQNKKNNTYDSKDWTGVNFKLIMAIICLLTGQEATFLDLSKLFLMQLLRVYHEVIYHSFLWFHFDINSKKKT